VATQLTFPDSNPGLRKLISAGEALVSGWRGVGLVWVSVAVVPSATNRVIGWRTCSRRRHMVQVELLMIAAVTVAGDAVGFVSRKSAQLRATCAWPWTFLRWCLSGVTVFQEEVMFTPGPKNI